MGNQAIIKNKIQRPDPLRKNMMSLNPCHVVPEEQLYVTCASGKLNTELGSQITPGTKKHAGSYTCLQQLLSRPESEQMRLLNFSENLFVG